MSHFAEISNDNKVIRVLVGDNNDPAGDEGYQYFINTFGGTWVKTSYNANIRYNYAGIGYTYDEIRDAFIAPEPGNAIGFDEDTCTWIVPEVEIETLAE